MLAKPGRPPRPPAGWYAEMKWDGVRALARCTSEGVSLWSRNLREITGSYPEVVAALAEITYGRTIMLDGELVAPTTPVRRRSPACSGACTSGAPRRR